MKLLFRHTYILVFIRDVEVRVDAVAAADVGVLTACADVPAFCACNEPHDGAVCLFYNENDAVASAGAVASADGAAHNRKQ